MRTKNSIINILVSMISQIITIIIVFPARSIFIRVLGAEILGVNGLFSNILSVLSIAELGIGSAIVFSLYTPIAENNKEKINAIMNLYRKAYRIIGIVVFGLGILISPMLKYIVDKPNNISNIYYVFMLFLINSSISYFLSYKRSIIIANQKGYIINLIHSLVLVLMNIMQVLILIYTRNYIVYLWIQLIFTVGENIIISFVANYKYKFLSDKNNKNLKVDNRTKNEIVKNIKALVIHKLGSITVLGTDNIIISAFVGVNIVGIYSNYCLITNALNAILTQIFNSLTASVGNLNVLESKEKKYNVYSNMLFLNFWIVSLASICLYELLNPFITIWIGSQYLMSVNVVLIIVINFYLNGMRHTTLTFKSASGLFWQDRYKPLVEAILNITISIVLAKSLGVIGVLLGTIISTILTTFWIEPYILFKYCFEKKIKKYFSKYFIYTVIMIITLIVNNIVTNLYTGSGILKIIYNLIVSVSVTNLIYLVIFIKTPELKYFYNIFKSRLGKIA